MVECARNNQIAAANRKSSAGIVDERECLGVTGIWVDGRQRAHDCAISTVLGHGVAEQCNIGRRLIDVALGHDFHTLERTDLNVQAGEEMRRGALCELCLKRR